MAKVAHHHPHTYEVMEKAQEWVGKIAIAAAIIGGAVILFGTIFTTQGHVTW
jgi:hypothetical protein